MIHWKVFPPPIGFRDWELSGTGRMRCAKIHNTKRSKIWWPTHLTDKTRREWPRSFLKALGWETQTAEPKSEKRWRLSLRRCSVGVRGALTHLRFWATLQWAGAMKPALPGRPLRRKNGGYWCLKWRRRVSGCCRHQPDPGRCRSSGLSTSVSATMNPPAAHR